jgi:hypothetical protein
MSLSLSGECRCYDERAHKTSRGVTLFTVWASCAEISLLGRAPFGGAFLLHLVEFSLPRRARKSLRTQFPRFANFTASFQAFACSVAEKTLRSLRLPRIQEATLRPEEAMRGDQFVASAWCRLDRCRQRRR